MAEAKSRRGQSRREKAKATRAAIIRAANQEFTENGYYGSTMGAIAVRAGVAVQTVHFVFHTKGELMGAVVDAAVLGDDTTTPPMQTPWFLAAIEEPDAALAVRRLVLGSAGIFDRVGVLHEVARAGAATDPDAAETFARLERLREDGYRQFVVGLEAKGSLRGDVDAATDVLLTLLGPGTSLTLVRDRGWAPERAMAWLADTVPPLIVE